MLTPGSMIFKKFLHIEKKMRVDAVIVNFGPFLIITYIIIVKIRFLVFMVRKSSINRVSVYFNRNFLFQVLSEKIS